MIEIWEQKNNAKEKGGPVSFMRNLRAGRAGMAFGRYVFHNSEIPRLWLGMTDDKPKAKRASPSESANPSQGDLTRVSNEHTGTPFSLCSDGMTLIEILVALAIFTISFLVLIDAQNLNVRNSAHARRMSVATILAQDKLTETLLKYKDKSFTEIGEKEEGAFEGEYSKYRWEITSRDFAYDLSFLAAMAGEKEEEAKESPLSAYLPKISQFIKNSSKEITVTVFWKEGAGERNVSLTTHLFNYKNPLPL